MTKTEIARRSDSLYHGRASRRELCDMVARREDEIETLRSEAMRDATQKELQAGGSDVRGVRSDVPDMEEAVEAQDGGPHEAPVVPAMQEGDAAHAAGGVLRVKLDDYARDYPPTRAHPTDAGLDIRTPVDVCVAGGGFVTIRTGVHIELPPKHVGLLKSKSGLNIKSGIVGEGVIDEGYDGEIVVRLYCMSLTGHQFKAGDKIIQLLVMPVAYPSVEVVDEISGGERGGNGFGSTGR